MSFGDIRALTLKRYLAPDNWYAVEYPEDWKQEPDEDGVPQFWNTAGGLGNLRLRGYKFKDARGSPAPAVGLLDDVLKKTAGSERVQLGGRVAVYAMSTGKLTPTDDLTTVHSWYLVGGAIALIVTYTLPTRDASTPIGASELTTVLKILSSVKFENESSRTSD